MMNYQSKNMSYRFYKEYFEDMDLKYYGKETEVEDIKVRNQGILEFEFDSKDSPYEQWKSLEGFQEIFLYTTYPGLLLGMGIEHRLSKKEILTNAGSISEKIAKEHALTEFEKFRIKQDQLYQSDFDKVLLNDNDLSEISNEEILLTENDEDIKNGGAENE